MELTVSWAPVPWYSRYHKGTIVSAEDVRTVTRVISRIYKHGKTGKVRLYSDDPFDHVRLLINSDPLIVVRKAGRFGKLYIERDLAMGESVRR